MNRVVYLRLLFVGILSFLCGAVDYALDLTVFSTALISAGALAIGYVMGAIDE